MSVTTATAAAGDAPRRRRAESATAVVRESGLPASLGELVLSVTGKSKLWRTERTEVARELCAHFQDGIEAGASPGVLAASFGDPKRAAKLITATRKKLRPLWWRSSRTSLRALGGFLLACVVIYAVLAARFFLYAPNVSRNIMNELNAEVLAVPATQRAWPLYLQAKLSFGELPEFMVSSRHDEPGRPGDEGWDELAAWLDSHSDAMAIVREAASKPVMGYVYRGGIDPELGRVMEVTNPGYKFDESIELNPKNPMVVGVLLPHLGEMRRFAKWLRSDAHLAASRGDGARFVEDIRAMLGIAEQIRAEQFLISDLVAIAVSELAYITVIREADRPDLLGREYMRDLAHLLAGFGGGHVSIDASAEILVIEDILQRFFSDDGNGDGHFIGGPMMDEMYTDWGVARPRGLPLLKAVQPVQSVLISSRAEVHELALQFVASSAVDDAMPPWRHHERTSDLAYSKMMKSGVYSAVPFLASISQYDDVMGPVESACGARDIAETRREAALTALAIESFRHARGAWPRALAELIPAYLPRVPTDPFDGKPLRYIAPTSEASQPLLYSVGVDCVDQHGQVPMTRQGRSNVHAMYIFKARKLQSSVSGATQLDINASVGDWVLWPEPPPAAEPQTPPDPIVTDIEIQ